MFPAASDPRPWEWKGLGPTHASPPASYKATLTTSTSSSERPRASFGLEAIMGATRVCLRLTSVFLLTPQVIRLNACCATYEKGQGQESAGRISDLLVWGRFALPPWLR